MSAEAIHITFDKGTLLISGVPEGETQHLPGVRFDPRTRMLRAPASYYREIVLRLHKGDIPYKDDARRFERRTFTLHRELVPRWYQAEAARAWIAAGSRGVVTMPTGAGKTILAVMLIEKTGRPTLIHVPTIDLMHQWHEVLGGYFQEEIGLLGGGYNEICALTVTTYDSAILHVSSKGNRFGLLIFDECHHLPGNQYQYAAISSIAPFRLGLTATPERTDGREALLYKLIGPLVYEADIQQLEGEALAPYKVITCPLDLNDAERRQYDAERQIYLDFLKSAGINMGTARGWNNFLYKASLTPEGRRAFQAYLTQKRLGLAAAAKIDKIWELLLAHQGDRILIFTQDNEMAYQIGQKFFLPVLTHHTRVKEREFFLQAFRDGTFNVLVTSKVLNEGVDVPEANVAIIVSGSGSVREHVQRLGRILRARPGKEAILYELIARDTGEHFINQRRRKHRAYKRPGSV